MVGKSFQPCCMVFYMSISIIILLEQHLDASGLPRRPRRLQVRPRCLEISTIIREKKERSRSSILHKDLLDSLDP
jgi:hypothetical protein